MQTGPWNLGSSRTDCDCGTCCLIRAAFLDASSLRPPKFVRSTQRARVERYIAVCLCRLGRDICYEVAASLRSEGRPGCTPHSNSGHKHWEQAAGKSDARKARVPFITPVAACSSALCRPPVRCYRRSEVGTVRRGVHDAGGPKETDGAAAVLTIELAPLKLLGSKAYFQCNAI